VRVDGLAVDDEADVGVLGHVEGLAHVDLQLALLLLQRWVHAREVSGIDHIHDTHDTTHTTHTTHVLTKEERR
jgi:hypothetical protein